MGERLEGLPAFTHLLLVYIAINNHDWNDKWLPQPTVLAACSALTINKHCWLAYAVNQVSVALIVSADAGMQGVQGSNPTDD